MQRENIKHGDVQFPFAIYQVKGVETIQSVQYTHWHEEAEFFIIRSGKARFRVHTEVKDLYPGDVVFITPGAIHGATKINGENCAFDAIVFHEHFVACKHSDLAHRYLQQLMHTHKEQVFLRDPSVAAHLDDIVRFYGQYGRDGCLLLKGKLLEVLYAVSASLQDTGESGNMKTEGITEIKAALLYIHEHYTEPLTLQDLAKTALLSEGYFDRLFRKIVGISPFTYILQYRIEQSMLMLSTERMNISQVANACGFNDFSYFSKCFRKHALVTPRDYRKQVLEKT
ncbi:MAG TPA: AraC family transcriptional regulator [Candidatus Limiplasma sp.]|nr:AraC family transcriptional regulator [Candidatus Limiplasma sp.]